MQSTLRRIQATRAPPTASALTKRGSVTPSAYRTSYPCIATPSGGVIEKDETPTGIGFGRWSVVGIKHRAKTSHWLRGCPVRRVGRSQVCIYHECHKLLEAHGGGPPEGLPRFRRIADQQIDLRRPIVARVDLDIALPLQADV